MSTHWLTLLGRFEQEPNAVVFKGGTTTLQDGQPGFEVANLLSDQYFGGGTIRANVQFRGRHERSAAGLILFYQPQSASFVQAQLGGFALCSVQTWAGQRWTTHGAVGLPDQLQSDVSYAFEARVSGSRVLVFLNGVHTLEVSLPFSLPRGQVGLWALGLTDIAFSGFAVVAEKPKLFVIMEFSSPFNDLFTDVIVPVGEKAGFEVIRADQIHGPGVVIADIERQIAEAKAVVADITPVNPNVFWEVGYAHAIRKPTVLIAERETQMPFDVSPFRILLYDNTIGGKAKLEDGLSRHLSAIQTQWAAG